MLGPVQEIPNHEYVVHVHIVVSYSMLMLINVLPWIQTMYKTNFCHLKWYLKMINSSKLFQIFKKDNKKTVREQSVVYLKINCNVLHIHEHA